MQRTCLFALYALFFSPALYAQQYIGLGLGQTSADISSVAPERDAILAANGTSCGSDVGFGTVTCDESVDDTDTGFRIYVGTHFTPHLAIEGFYADLGSYSTIATATDSSGTVTAQGDVEASAFGVAAIGFLPVGSFDLLAKAGVARRSADGTATIRDETTTISDSMSEDSIDPMLGVGAQWNIGNFSIRAEYERYIGESDTTETDIDSISVSAIFRL